MKKILVPAALALAALAPPGAGANGSPYSPGLVHGWDGVLAPGGDVRYVTIDAHGTTIVAAVQTAGGRVARFRALKGMYGVPLVAYDGTSGGLSGDGRLLAVASYGPQPGTPGTTRFAVLRTRTLGVRRMVTLRGAWSYDASSPDGRRLFLVEHIAAGPAPRYRIRILDVEHGRLLPGALVDRLEKEAVMGGQPATRISTRDGRWAYTLYARASGEPFVHALDTERAASYCIDLPLQLAEPEQMLLRLRLDGGQLRVLRAGEAVATVSTTTFEVRRG